jgi:hypothetical protein
MVVGSISYGTNIADAYRRAGRVLSGQGQYLRQQE